MHSLRQRIIFRQHIHHNEIHQAIIVDVSKVGSHRRVTLERKIVSSPVGEGAVTVIQIEYIIWQKIVSCVNVGPTIAVYIQHIHTQSVSLKIGRASCRERESSKKLE